MEKEITGKGKTKLGEEIAADYAKMFKEAHKAGVPVETLKEYEYSRGVRDGVRLVMEKKVREVIEKSLKHCLENKLRNKIEKEVILYLKKAIHDFVEKQVTDGIYEAVLTSFATGIKKSSIKSELEVKIDLAKEMLNHGIDEYLVLKITKLHKSYLRSSDGS